MYIKKQDFITASDFVATWKSKKKQDDDATAVMATALKQKNKRKNYVDFKDLKVKVVEINRLKFINNLKNIDAFFLFKFHKNLIYSYKEIEKRFIEVISENAKLLNDLESNIADILKFILAHFDYERFTFIKNINDKNLTKKCNNFLNLDEMISNLRFVDNDPIPFIKNSHIAKLQYIAKNNDKKSILKHLKFSKNFPKKTFLSKIIKIPRLSRGYFICA